LTKGSTNIGLTRCFESYVQELHLMANYLKLYDQTVAKTVYILPQNPSGPMTYSTNIGERPSQPFCREHLYVYWTASRPRRHSVLHSAGTSMVQAHSLKMYEVGSLHWSIRSVS